VESVLQAAGWDIIAIDSGRDCGWSITCRCRAAEVEIAIAEVQPSEWMLQIAPTFVPGFLSRLRGRKPSAGRKDVLELATHVHEFLEDEFEAQRWCWNGCPDDGRSTPAPTRWNGAGQQVDDD
jgi:hypothetical protein